MGRGTRTPSRPAPIFRRRLFVAQCKCAFTYLAASCVCVERRPRYSPAHLLPPPVLVCMNEELEMGAQHRLVSEAEASNVNVESHAMRN